jgi:uncharacterized protein YuzE
MKLQYDQTVDAAYVDVLELTPPGEVALTERLDQDRNVDYDAAYRIIGYEFLNVLRYGVRLDDLDHREELTRLFAEAGFHERDWGAPLSALRPVHRKQPTG